MSEVVNNRKSLQLYHLKIKFNITNANSSSRSLRIYEYSVYSTEVYIKNTRGNAVEFDLGENEKLG
jgi:hypothetical protein